MRLPHQVFQYSIISLDIYISSAVYNVITPPSVTMMLG